jgi:hypothetical protein
MSRRGIEQRPHARIESRLDDLGGKQRLGVIDELAAVFLSYNSGPNSRSCSARNSAGIRGQLAAGTSIFSQPGSGLCHLSKKNPRRPNGVLIAMNRQPLATACIGRKPAINASSIRDASSKTIRFALE